MGQIVLIRRAAVAAAMLLAVTAFASEAWSREPKRVRCHEMTDMQANLLFAEWNNALKEGPDAVIQKYTTDAVLLPTFENGPYVGRAKIREYFVHFLEKHPVGRIDTRAIIPAGCNMGVVAGLYTFEVDKEASRADGPPRVDSPARYTYVYTYNQIVGRWQISHHHSSAQPQPK